MCLEPSLGSSDSADTTEGRTYRWKMAASTLPYNPFLLVYNILCFVMAFLQSPRPLHAATQQRKSALLVVEVPIVKSQKVQFT